MKYLLLVSSIIISTFLSAQTGSLHGIVFSPEGPIGSAEINISENLRTVTDQKGRFTLTDVPVGKQSVFVSHDGYQSIYQEVVIIENETLEISFSLLEDYLNLEGVVVTATRNNIPVYRSPVIVSRIDSQTFETTQSLALSEGLNFTPGLRLETNCQNCGFTQVRMNGLEGSYSQILINSRPIFSALMGVYGLDMLPADMIDRVEVVRGGGSALYGGNAIAGTINIITKDPVQNTFSIGTNYAYIDYQSPDKTINVNGSMVSDDLNKGIAFYAYNRERKPWDYNHDGFSEVTKLQNTTFGFDSFWSTSERSKLKLNLFNINEFRRGGNKFHLPAHQTDITEQLEHKILGGGSSFEIYSHNYKHKFSVYVSAQTARRNSYYGGGGRVITEGETLTDDDIVAINAYGKSEDLSLIGGSQYSYEINEVFLLLAGAEYQRNRVEDRMPGYNRLIDQQVEMLGTYSQLEIKPTNRLTFLVGARYDHVAIEGKHNLAVQAFQDEKQLDVFVPRITAMYALTDFLKARASYSQGYRAPQAFDEDLHIETVGGAASFTMLSPDLKTEKSSSYNASLNYIKPLGKVQTNLVAEGFYTRLNDAFITADARELLGGISVLTKKNGSGATVAGINIEASFAFSGALNLQMGSTIQRAEYTKEEEIWVSEDETEKTSTRNLLRTPDLYGYYALNYNPVPNLTVSFSGVYTGVMKVPHVVDADSEKTIIKTTPDFFENNLKIAYDFDIKDNCIQIYSGVLNMFNAYQNDFDIGPLRDAGYIYGPSRPQTLFAGVKYNLN